MRKARMLEKNLGWLTKEKKREGQKQRAEKANRTIAFWKKKNQSNKENIQLTNI